MRSLKLGTATVELHDSGLTVTRLADGKEIPAVAQNDVAYAERALLLGYGQDIGLMSREHEVLHTLLSVLLGLSESPTLRGVADGLHWPHWRDEEAMVLAAQRFCRLNDIDVVAVAERLSKQS